MCLVLRSAPRILVCGWTVLDTEYEVTTRRDIIGLLGFVLIHGTAAVSGTGSDEGSKSNSTTGEIEDTDMSDHLARQLGVPTLGGMQFWGDVCFFQGYWNTEGFQ